MNQIKISAKHPVFETFDCGSTSMKYLLVLFAIHCIACKTARCQELPIKPARTISFTTNEGSYMNVDISPDGKMLAFDLLGELYTMPVTGGIATQITRGIALNICPIWSPDGRRIAYISDITGDYHVTVTGSGGGFYTTFNDLAVPHQYYTYPGHDSLTNYTPLWTPDSHYIGDGRKFYGIAAGQLPNNPAMTTLIRFSPDGKLAYGIDSGKIYKYDISRKQKDQLSINKIRGPGELSPDGRWWCRILDSADRHELIIREIVTGNEKILVAKLETADPRYTAGIPSQHFCFSSDSKFIYISYGGKIHRIEITGGADHIIPFLAKVTVSLGTLNYHTYRVKLSNETVRYTRSASKSPDGKHLVFVALDRIYMMDLPNGKPHILCAQRENQFQPCWSPDGKWVAYVSWSDTAGGYLWKVSSSGGHPVKLTQLAGQYQHPCWSPDGKWVAVIKGGPIRGNDNLSTKLYATGKGPPTLGNRDDIGIGELQLVASTGVRRKALADSVLMANNIVFSAHGKGVQFAPAFAHKRNSLLDQLIQKDTDNYHEKAIAKGGSLTFYWPKLLSPDGKYLVYSVDEDLYLIPISQLTDTAVISDPKHALQIIRFAAGVDPIWQQGGKVLGWTYGNSYHEIETEKIIAAAEQTLRKEQTSGTIEKDFITTNVVPDQTIDLKINLPASYGRGMIVLKNARIITMRGKRVIENGTIVIRDGRFIAVGTNRSISTPAGAKIVDLSGKTIIPGLIDLHLHMGVPPDIFPQQSWMYLVNLAYGVTTARDPSLNFDSFGYAELLSSGQMLGPRLFTVGNAVRFTGGVIRFDSQADADRVVSKRTQFGGSEIKQYSLPTRLQRERLAIASQKYGLNMTNEGAHSPLEQIGMVKDGSTGVEHNPDFGDIYKDIITLYSRSGIYFTPTLQVTPTSREISAALFYLDFKYWHGPNPKLKLFMPIIQSGLYDKLAAGNTKDSYEAITTYNPTDTPTAAFLYAAQIDASIRHSGGNVTLGSHGNNEGIGAHNELWALQIGGLSNMEALQAGTIMGAQALGVQKDLGSIEVGKIADLVILNSNPLDDIHNSRDIKYVMKDGILYDGDTLDEIWPVKKKCPEWRLKNNHSETNK